MIGRPYGAGGTGGMSGTIAPALQAGAVSAASPQVGADNSPVSEITPRDLLVPSMSSWDSIFRASFWYAGFNPDAFLTHKRYDTLDDMLTMAACRAPFNILRYTILRSGWKIEAGVTDPNDGRHEEATRRAKALDYALRNIRDAAGNVQDFRQVLFEWMGAAWYGFHVCDVIFRMVEGGMYDLQLGYAAFAPKPCKQMGFDMDRDTMAVINVIPYTPLSGYGPPIPSARAVRYTFAPSRNLPHGNGLGRSCHKHYFLLDKTLQFWAVAAERYGGPVPVFKYPAGSDDEMNAAAKAADQYRQGKPLIVPNNVTVEMQVMPGDAFDGFKTKADWHAEQIRQVVLGNTLSTSEGDRVGSMALGQVHQDTGEDVAGFIRTDLENVATYQVAERFNRVNYDWDNTGDPELCPRVSLSGEGERDPDADMKTMQMFHLAIQDGVTHKRAKQVRERLGMPPLDPDEEKLLDKEDHAAQEMQQAQTDAKLQGKAKMTDAQFDRWLEGARGYVADMARARKAARA